MTTITSTQPAVQLPAPPRPHMLSVGKLALLLSLIAVAMTAISLPLVLDFEWYMFGDPGMTIKVHWLLQQGLRPFADFGFAYGLTTLAFGEALFAIFPATPITIAIANTCLNILMAINYARIIHALRLRGWGLALALVVMPFIINESYGGFVYSMERCLLIWALAEHITGHRPRALAVLVLCALTKPSMAYLYGFVLVLLMVWRAMNMNTGGARPVAAIFKYIARDLLPAAITAVIASSILMAWFGGDTFLASLFPAAGKANYVLKGYGFFTPIGMGFWWPEKVPWQYFFDQPPGVWILSSLVLLAVGAWCLHVALNQRRYHFTIQHEIALTCAALHLLFILLLFGHGWSWVYYAQILFIGVLAVWSLAANSSRPRIASLRRPASWLMVTLVGLSHLSMIEGIHFSWATKYHEPETQNLFAYPQERREWLTMLQLSHDLPGPKVVLSYSGCADLTYPQFEPIPTWFLDLGLVPNSEMTRVREKIASASTLIIYHSWWSSKPWDWPELADIRRDFKLVRKQNVFSLWERKTERSSKSEDRISKAH